MVLATAFDERAMLDLSALPTDHVPPEAIARWDFSQQSSRTVRDRSTNGLHGRTVNLPTRAVTGRRWDGSSISFEDRPDCMRRSISTTTTSTMPVGPPTSSSTFRRNSRAGCTREAVPR